MKKVEKIYVRLQRAERPKRNKTNNEHALPRCCSYPGCGEEAQVWRDISNIKNGVLGSLLLATSSTVNSLYGETLIMAFLEEAPSPGSRST